jgi:hypothetical protein
MMLVMLGMGPSGGLRANAICQPDKCMVTAGGTCVMSTRLLGLNDWLRHACILHSMSLLTNRYRAFP